MSDEPVQEDLEQRVETLEEHVEELQFASESEEIQIADLQKWIEQLGERLQENEQVTPRVESVDALSQELENVTEELAELREQIR